MNIVEYTFNDIVIKMRGEKFILFDKKYLPVFKPGLWFGKVEEKERCKIFTPLRVPYERWQSYGVRYSGRGCVNSPDELYEELYDCLRKISFYKEYYENYNNTIIDYVVSKIIKENINEFTSKVKLEREIEEENIPITEEMIEIVKKKVENDYTVLKDVEKITCKKTYFKIGGGKFLYKKHYDAIVKIAEFIPENENEFAHWEHWKRSYDWVEIVDTEIYKWLLIFDDTAMFVFEKNAQKSFREEWAKENIEELNCKYNAIENLCILHRLEPAKNKKDLLELLKKEENRQRDLILKIEEFFKNLNL